MEMIIEYAVLGRTFEMKIIATMITNKIDLNITYKSRFGT